LKVNLHNFQRSEEAELVFNGEDIHIDDLIEGEVVYPIKGKLVLQKIGDRFLLDGVITVVIKRKCAVCGEPFDDTLKVNLSDEFIIGEPDYSDDKEVELTQKDMNTFYLKDGILDVESVVRDYIITSLSTVPLCPVHRKKDREPVIYNLGDIEEKPADPRWAELRKLLEGGAEGGSSKEETNTQTGKK